MAMAVVVLAATATAVVSAAVAFLGDVAVLVVGRNAGNVRILWDRLGPELASPPSESLEAEFARERISPSFVALSRCPPVPK